MPGSTTRTILTSESVTEGHPDKVADTIADRILDACLEQDPASRVACEVLCKAGRVVLAGEVTSRARFDREALVRRAIADIGYTDPAETFSSRQVDIHDWLTEQSSEIFTAVGPLDSGVADLGAGDQGMMIGYATSETTELMPLPIVLAHRLSARLAHDRHSGVVPWLKPDGKTQVSVSYRDGEPETVTAVVVSTQHLATAPHSQVVEYVTEVLVPQALGDYHRPGLRIHANPSGSFVHGGPSADCGLTGRKLSVDTYGGIVRHGGGALSGKDPTKVDRSGAYFCRFVARALVRAGMARRAEISVAYAIGEARPVSVSVETFGTGDPRAAEEFVNGFDFRPGAMIERLQLLRPIYAAATNYGHFGRPGLPWEADV